MTGPSLRFHSTPLAQYVTLAVLKLRCLSVHLGSLPSCALLPGQAVAQIFWNIWIFSARRYSKYFTELKEPFVQTSGLHHRMLFIIMEATGWSEISCRNYFV